MAFRPYLQSLLSAHRFERDRWPETKAAAHRDLGKGRQTPLSPADVERVLYPHTSYRRFPDRRQP